MKRILVILMFVLSLTLSSKAQMDTVSGPDGHVEGWHVSFWYDTCAEYWDTSRVRFSFYGLTAGVGSYCLSGLPQYVEHPSAVKGVAVWVDPYPEHVNAYLDSITKMPEYVYVVQKGADTMIFLDRARWDTAECKVLKLPLNHDTARRGFAYCHLYTAYFDKPVEVDSIFYLCGTHKSNVVEGNMDIYRRTSYMNVYTSMPMSRYSCRTPYPQMDYYDSTFWNPAGRNKWFDSRNSESYGMFIPLIDMVEMRVETTDSTMGTAGPSGERSPNTWQTIWARARSGYRFSHWNDGDTNNPRQIRLMHDTLFTAYFGYAEQHTVSVSSNTTMGHVDGGGTYYYGDTAVLKAVPEAINYTFVRWNDSVTDNPRKVVVRSDTAFTAYFKRKGVEGIEEAETEAVRFTLVPNPAREKVMIELEGLTQRARLSMHDMKGREVWGSVVTGERDVRELDLAPYASGVYFVTLTTEKSIEVRRLIVGE